MAGGRKNSSMTATAGQFVWIRTSSQTYANWVHDIEKAAVSDSLSDDALKHFKTYKYSSVDKSPVSKYILRHYVCSFVPMPRDFRALIC